MRGWIIGAALMAMAPGAWAQTGPGRVCTNKLEVGTVQEREASSGVTQFYVQLSNRHAMPMLVAVTARQASAGFVRTPVVAQGIASRINPGASQSVVLGTASRGAFNALQVQNWLGFRCN